MKRSLRKGSFNKRIVPEANLFKIHVKKMNELLCKVKSVLHINIMALLSSKDKS